MEQLELRLTQTNNRNTAVRTEKRTIEVIITNISITSINISISISITSISILVHTSDPPDDAICKSVMRSLVVAAEKTADRIFLFISNDATISTVTMDNVTRRAIPWLFFRNFIAMNSILMVS